MTEQAQNQAPVEEQAQEQTDSKIVYASAVLEGSDKNMFHLDTAGVETLVVDRQNIAVIIGDELNGPDHDTSNDKLTIVLAAGYSKFTIFPNRWLGNLDIKNTSGKPYDTAFSSSVVTITEAVSDPAPATKPVGKSSSTGCKYVDMRDLM